MEHTDRISRLERLQRLREAGALTEAEFAREKALVLNHGEDEDPPARRSKAPFVLGLLALAVSAGVLLAVTTPTTEVRNAAMPRARQDAARSAAMSDHTGPGRAVSSGGVQPDERSDPPGASIPTLTKRWLQFGAACQAGGRTADDDLCLAWDEATKALNQTKGLLDL